MNPASRKALKIIMFFVGLIAYIIWANGYYGVLSLQHLSTGFLMAAAAYVAISLFSLLSPSCGGLIALIGTVAGFFGIAWIMDKVSAAISWLDIERMLWIFTIITTICMILDIRYIIHSLHQPKAEQLSCSICSWEYVRVQTLLSMVSVYKKCSRSPQKSK